ncbi:uncharacterized protein HMPREF1541_01903 [Cyphellophora europaea CBS 101466]|uniref:C2H2-type domain-containing protein n=1 Tax=Cyphellophora europaea (strain CBS 101466) TaxID=1220924 RepID=W2S2D0_CYPE1|nr:uncharacterized protein HMPREF1541_01903 [Cyphellophora europaea CBS 101466]ETN42745.1 hypothetical protein HMPREF1541_01903 [Cyphellophora europaea CBS 101466]
MPRPPTLPPAATASARAARAAFFCDLCQKGYSRMNEYEAHESSYDHQHKKRLKEMKEMQRQVKDSVPRKEEKGPLMTIKLGGNKEKEAGAQGAGGFKKGGFKKMNAFVAIEGEDDESVKKEDAQAQVIAEAPLAEADSDFTDEDDYYDPRRPTGCPPGCSGLTAG